MTTVDDLERELRTLAANLTTPRDGECLLCYVNRMLERHGCTGLRWATRYRDLRAPRATALEQRLGRKGGYCDCEVFLNGYELRAAHWVTGKDGEPTYPDPMPRCHGVRRGSTQPCGLWVAQWRPWR